MNYNSTNNTKKDTCSKYDITKSSVITLNMGISFQRVKKIRNPPLSLSDSATLIGQKDRRAML